MAKEIQFAGTSGATHYALVFDAVGRVDAGLSGFVTYAGGSYASYVGRAASELGSSGVFTCDFNPNGNVAAGVYGVVAKRQAGGSPAQSDETVAAGDLHWDGSAVVSRSAVGLATPAEAAGRPTTSLGMIRRTFERGANKRTRDRATGVVAVRNAADSADLESSTQSTAGTVDAQTAGA